MLLLAWRSDSTLSTPMDTTREPVHFFLIQFIWESVGLIFSHSCPFAFIRGLKSFFKKSALRAASLYLG
jgi:hypothetical protein